MTEESSPRIETRFKGKFIFMGVLVFCALFMILDNAYFRFADSHFPSVGESAWLATLWGVVSRAHLILPILALVLWLPRYLGFQIGKTFQHWRMLLIMLILNCGVIGGYLWLTQGTTPYSKDIWLVTEVITVPLVEEIFWRGIVFTVLMTLLRKIYPEKKADTLTVLLTGVAFGLLHANNLFAGVPLNFVVIQVLNATIWGLVYSYARLKTESVYPSIVLHSAMNLIAILF